MMIRRSNMIRMIRINMMMILMILINEMIVIATHNNDKWNDEIDEQMNLHMYIFVCGRIKEKRNNENTKRRKLQLHFL